MDGGKKSMHKPREIAGLFYWSIGHLERHTLRIQERPSLPKVPARWSHGDKEAKTGGV